MHNGIEVPANAEIKTSSFGDHKYYVSAITETHVFIKILKSGKLERISLASFNKLGY